MAIPKFTVTFDNGDTFDLQVRSRDMAKAEAEGFDFGTTPPVRGSYQLALYVLHRLVRSGQIEPTDPLPETVDDLIVVADLEAVEDEDPEGKGSGQEATPG